MPRLSTSCVAPCLLIFLCGVMCLLNSEPCLSPIIFYMTQIDRWDNLPSFHIYLHKTMFLFSSLGKEEICMETIYIFYEKKEHYVLKKTCLYIHSTASRYSSFQVQTYQAIFYLPWRHVRKLGTACIRSFL